MNNIFVFGTSDGVILRWNIENGGESEEIEISKKPEVTCHPLLCSIVTSCCRISFIISSWIPPGIMSSSDSSMVMDFIYTVGQINQRSYRSFMVLLNQLPLIAFGSPPPLPFLLIHFFKATETNTKSFLIGTSTGLPSLSLHFSHLFCVVSQERFMKCQWKAMEKRNSFNKFSKSNPPIRYLQFILKHGASQLSGTPLHPSPHLLAVESPVG
jgi:hypothetical protein